MRCPLCSTLILVAVMLVWVPISVADGHPFRVFNNQKYEILEARSLYIYSTDVLVRKGTLDKAYFFSLGPAGQILPLTILNLKKTLPNNDTFHDSPDMIFNNDSQLTKWDDFHKTYKVNRLFEASKRQ